MVSDSFPRGPQSVGEHAGSGQKSDTVGTFKPAAICIGPVLDETSTLQCDIIAISARKAFLAIPMTLAGSARVITETSPASEEFPIARIWMSSLRRRSSASSAYRSAFQLGADLPLPGLSPISRIPGLKPRDSRTRSPLTFSSSDKNTSTARPSSRMSILRPRSRQ